MPSTDLQNTPAMSPAASVASVVRSCTSSTRDKDRQGLAAGRCLAPCTSGCPGHTVEHLEGGTTSPRRASHPATEWRCTHRAQDSPTRFPSRGKAHDGAAELGQELGLDTKPPPAPRGCGCCWEPAWLHHTLRDARHSPRRSGLAGGSEDTAPRAVNVAAHCNVLVPGQDMLGEPLGLPAPSGTPMLGGGPSLRQAGWHPQTPRSAQLRGDFLR